MKRLTSRKREQGVTLVELMIVVAILGMVMAATYNMFAFQQKSYTIQDNVAVMQQNVRVGLEYMIKEIRMAGYAPEGIPPLNSAPTDDAVTSPSFTTDGTDEPIEEATLNTITFQADIDNDTMTETVRYALDGTDLTREVWEWSAGAWSDEDGLADPQIVAEDIESISFTYFLLGDEYGMNNGVVGIGFDDDGNDGVDEPGELVTWDFGVNGALDTRTERGYIRQINLTMTARAQSPDAGYTHPQVGDHYRRRILTSDICLRNMK
jgi:prepilin-type N-terminal cleavage/methylation domain-containing protein